MIQVKQVHVHQRDELSGLFMSLLTVCERAAEPVSGVRAGKYSRCLEKLQVEKCFHLHKAVFKQTRVWLQRIFLTCRLSHVHD